MEEAYQPIQIRSSIGFMKPEEFEAQWIRDNVNEKR